MKKLNKAIAIALSAVTVFSASSVVPITANAKVTNVVSSSATATSGNWGSNAKWSYNSKTKTLTITGKGTLKNADVKLPSKIDHIVVKEGITVLEDGVLNWIWPKDITLPTSIREIKGYAFAMNECDWNEEFPYREHVIIYAEAGSVTETYCDMVMKEYESDMYQFMAIFKPIKKSGNNNNSNSSGNCGSNNVKWKLGKNGKMTIYGKGTMYGKPATQTFDKRKVKEVVVNNGITNIYGGCFRDYKNLKKVTIPNSVTVIGAKAFSGCKNLKTVVMSKNVQQYNNYVFENCSSLKSVPSLKNVKKIGMGIFKNCSSITKVDFPNSYSNVPYEMFYGCKNLTNVTLSEKVNEIGDYSFAKCTKLKNVNFLKNITSIGGNAFRGCSSIEKVTLNDNAKIYTENGTYSENVFSGCSKLKDIVVSKNNKYYTSVDGLIYSKDKKTLVQYPLGNTRTTFTIPDFVTKIVVSAFRGSKNIKKLVIPGNVTNVSEKAFANCSNLETVTLPDNFKEISNYVFSGCSKLKSINFPTTLKNIGYNAFYNCASLCEINLNNGLKDIGERAFKSCKGLTSVTIPNSVTKLRDSAFQNCTKLKNVKLSDNTNSIYYYAFSNCVSLTDITIPSNVTYVDTYAFVNCKSLSKFNVSKDNKTFSSVRGMLYNKNGDKLILFPMNKATSYSLPKGTKTIGKSAFENGKIKKITLPNTLKKIDGAAFLNCKNLYSINIPSSVTEINANILRGTKYYKTSKNWYKDQLYVSNCVVAAKKNIKAVSLKSSTRLIAKFAYDSNKVTTVKLPNGIKYINTSAFYYCDKLKKIILPKSLVSIGDGAFAYGVTFYVYKNSVGYEYAKNTYCLSPNKYKIIK